MSCRQKVKGEVIAMGMGHANSVAVEGKQVSRMSAMEHFKPRRYEGGHINDILFSELF